MLNHLELSNRKAKKSFFGTPLFVRKVCNKYSVVILLLLQYAPTDDLAEEETSLRPKKKSAFAGEPNFESQIQAETLNLRKK